MTDSKKPARTAYKVAEGIESYNGQTVPDSRILDLTDPEAAYGIGNKMLTKAKADRSASTKKAE